jgi:hypothetical protein
MPIFSAMMIISVWLTHLWIVLSPLVVLASIPRALLLEGKLLRAWGLVPS